MHLKIPCRWACKTLLCFRLGRLHALKGGGEIYPCNRPWRPIGLWYVEVPTFSRQSARRWRWSCQRYALAAFYLQEDFWYSFLLEAESTPGP
jgi:hypothetical protein